jgi:hypothetical protein
MTDTPTKLRCMTCSTTFTTSDPNVFKVVTAFDDICICWPCVRIYRKETPPDPSARE